MKKNILTISDSKNFHYVIQAIFKGRHAVFTAETESDALSALAAEKINLIILTPSLKAGLKQQSSFKFLEGLRASGKKFADTPVILAASNVTSAVISKAQKNKVSEIIKLPFDPIVLDSKAEETLLKFSHPREHPDVITGLPKKYMGELTIAELLAEGKKGTLLMIDLDHYSFVCTSVTDKTLITCRNIIQEEIEDKDKAVLAVMKGGGFLLFVPDLRDKEKILDYAARLIEKILERIKDEKIYVSIGLAVSERHGKNYEDLCFACDRGLGEARKHGKNMAKFYSW
ncbi:MAG: diguanylate cyclase [Oscillospiraceae bacterium]|nr:diguanylate cyclase [Oscillospiraceae bacterium]